MKITKTLPQFIKEKIKNCIAKHESKKLLTEPTLENLPINTKAYSQKYRLWM